ncbi:MAG: hypothetical protein ACKVYV_17460 [Limisphaerales bacterium]
MSPRVKSLLAATVLAALVLFAGPAMQPVLQRGLEAVAALGWRGPVVFALVHAAATVLRVPGSVLTPGAGALFGLGRDFATVLYGATLWATLAFLVGRHLAGDRVTTAARGIVHAAPSTRAPRRAGGGRVPSGRRRR